MCPGWREASTRCRMMCSRWRTRPRRVSPVECSPAYDVVVGPASFHATRSRRRCRNRAVSCARRPGRAALKLLGCSRLPRRPRPACKKYFRSLEVAPAIRRRACSRPLRSYLRPLGCAQQIDRLGHSLSCRPSGMLGRIRLMPYIRQDAPDSHPRRLRVPGLSNVRMKFAAAQVGVMWPGTLLVCVGVLTRGAALRFLPQASGGTGASNVISLAARTSVGSGTKEVVRAITEQGCRNRSHIDCRVAVLPFSGSFWPHNPTPDYRWHRRRTDLALW
jgi:hypothetical protein